MVYSIPNWLPQSKQSLLAKALTIPIILYNIVYIGPMSLLNWTDLFVVDFDSINF